MLFKVCPPLSPDLKTAAPVCGVLWVSGPEKESAAPHGSEGPAGDEPGLEGRRILVVEDEFLLALEVEAALTSFGCFVAGPFAKLGKALVAARATRLDGAVLDINLNGEMVYPLAEFLDMAGVPFVFLTGYVSSDLPERFRRFRKLQKPLHTERLRHIIRDMLHGGTGGGAR
jgi:DNA-binding NtrC family response regulator